MRKNPSHPYHTMAVSAALLHVRSSERGLSDRDAAGRLRTFGGNVLPEQPQTPAIVLFARQLLNPLVMIVIAAATISVFIGHIVDAIFIAGVVVVNATVSFVQEYKAHHTLQQLRDSVTQMARVVRGGRKKKIPAAELVVGDVVDVMAGDRITADGRVIAAHSFFVHEAALTGEWHDVEKTTEVIAGATTVGDQSNMAFAGTSAVQGHMRYVVTATGADTEIGKIADAVQSAQETQTPLQKQLTRLSFLVGGGIVFAIVLFVIVGVWREQSVTDIFLAATALIVSAIPEGLLPAITIVLIFGMRRLAKHSALVRRLNASETMGAITVICTDKTGTLTTGEMMVSHVLTGANDLLNFSPSALRAYKRPDAAQHLQALTIASVVNDAYVENLTDKLVAPIAHGRPTDKALLMAAVQAGIDPEEFSASAQLVDQRFFTSESKFATRVFRMDDKRIQIMMLGAPEEVMKRVTHIDVRGRRMPLQSAEGAKLKKTLATLTGQGLRVVACAHRVLAEESYNRLRADDRVTGLSLVAYIALKDPLRTDVASALATAQRAGIRTMIITGDHAATAQSVMAALGRAVSPSAIRTGADLADLTDRQLRTMVRKTAIFARVLPEHKIRIVRALQADGEVVAMVGDGINDAPALKAADVGIAIGEGADIAKEVSDIVLLNSGFGTIVTAIEQGRVIYENIRRTFIYLIADDFSEIFLFFCAAALGWPLPLLAVQVLWINVIEDSFPNVALTTEYDTTRLMEEPPRNPRDPMLTRAHKKFMTVVFAVSGAAAGGLFWYVWHTTNDVAMARTATFALIAFDSLTFVYTVRNLRRCVARRDIFDNRLINIAVAVSLVLLLAGIYLSPLTHILGTVALSPAMWLVVVGIAIAEMMFFEVAKRVWLYYPQNVPRPKPYLQRA